MAIMESSLFLGQLARMFSRQHDKLVRASVLAQIPENAICAEIGVYKGHFSDLIWERNPKKLHLIDPWKFELDPSYAASWYGGSLGRSQAYMDAIYRSVVRRFRAAIKSGAIEVHRGSSAKCCAQFSDDYFDWVYIDGNHQYDFVKQDLEMYLPKVKRHGLIAGDDYGTPGWWQDGVTQAVDEAVGSGRVERLHIENHQFLLRKA